MYKVDIDWEKAGALGVPVSSIQSYLSAAFGSAYIGNFVQGGRVKRVYAQADAPFRMLPGDLDRLYVRNRQGGLVPLSAVASGRWVYGSPRLERYNSFPAMNIQGEAAPGHAPARRCRRWRSSSPSSRQGIGYEWTGLSYQQRMSESQAGLLYAFSILVIFLVLAALYESWTFPISVMLALPLGVIGGVLASSLRGMPNDVYFQIGLLTVLGLTTKNAILIVQFATPAHRAGDGAGRGHARGGQAPAAPDRHDLARVRLRRAAAGDRHRGGRRRQKAIGTSVLGGMITGTFLADLLHPAVLRAGRAGVRTEAAGRAARSRTPSPRARRRGTDMKRDDSSSSSARAWRSPAAR